MKFTITLDIQKCGDCPLQEYVMEHGGPCGYMCHATTRIYPIVDYEKIADWCPLKEENKEERIKNLM